MPTISSMTGYASRTGEVARASVSVEVKSVNSRFLDVTFRLHDDLRVLEPMLRERIALHAQRGKIECRMAIAVGAEAAPSLALNETLLGTLADASRRVQAAIPGAQPLRVAEVLNWPGMLADQAGSGDALRQGALALFDENLKDFAASRAREGEKLKATIAERVEGIRRVLLRVAPLV
ncbi:MAG: YicC/YloC family endoribonuclease, partial [Burkholderiales bacterium]